MKITSAVLYYGTSAYPIDVDDPLFPFLDLDENNVEEAAYRAMAILSNQSGGHLIHNGRLSLYKRMAMRCCSAKVGA